jgi:2'-5' RNA ligase
MRNHWWWRPGWSQGRSFYTWHLTFQDQPDVHRFAEAYRHALAPAEGLDLIPDRWLHLTMQGIGFSDEVPDHVVRDIEAAATRRLAALHSFGITLHAPIVDPEAILVPVQPAEPVRALRDEIRAAIGDVLPEVPEAADGFTPHVSIGYSNSEGPAAPFAAAIADAAVDPAKALITDAELIRINRDHQMYEWTTVARVSLG